MEKFIQKASRLNHHFRDRLLIVDWLLCIVLLSGAVRKLFEW